MPNRRSAVLVTLMTMLCMIMFAGCHEREAKSAWLGGQSVEALHARARALNQSAQPRAIGSGDRVGEDLFRIYRTEVIAARLPEVGFNN